MNARNYAGIVIAQPEFGKTSIEIEIGDALLDQGVKLFVHDPNKQFRGRCAEYGSIAAYEGAARAAANDNKPIAAGSSFAGACKATEVRDFVVKLGQARNDVDRIAVPLGFFVDEGSRMGSSGSTYISDEDQELLANRRHYGIAVLYLIQRSKMLTGAFVDLATDVYIYWQPERRIAQLEELVNLPAGALAGVATLPKHRYVHVRLGEGIVGDRI